MNDTEVATQRSNIDHFAEQLRSERSPNRRAVLRNLLLYELNRYGCSAVQLDMIDSRLADNERLIARQRGIIERLRADTGDATEAESFLLNLMSVRTIFEEFRARVLKAL